MYDDLRSNERKDRAIAAQAKAEDFPLGTYAGYERVFHILDDTRITAEEEQERSERADHLLHSLPHKSADERLNAALGGLIASLDIPKIDSLVDRLQDYLTTRIGERISASTERYDGKLESCLGAAQMRFTYTRDGASAVAALYYNILRSHPYHDGNKKIATAFLLQAMRGAGLKPDVEDLGNLPQYIIRTPSGNSDQVIAQIARFIGSMKSGGQELP